MGRARRDAWEDAKVGGVADWYTRRCAIEESLLELASSSIIVL